MEAIPEVVKKMSLAERIQKLPKWSQNLLALLLGLCLSVCFPTLDSFTDNILGGGLMMVRGVIII